MDARYGVLGTVEAWMNGAPITLERPRHRALLGLLLVHPNKQLSTDFIVDQLWGDNPPRTARNQVHGSISTLRRAFGTSGESITTHGTAYSIAVPPDGLDSQLFEDTVLSSQHSDDLETKATLLRQALAIWRGIAFDHVQASYADAARERLNESRLSAHESLCQTLIQLGQYTEAISVLLTLVQDHPLRETFRGQLMRALHGAGRQAEALQCFEEGRLALAEELGISPSQPLLELHTQILRNELVQAEPRGSLNAGKVRAGADKDHSRCYLPYDLPDFTGRAAEMKYIGDATEEASSALTILAFDGMAGVGKTALAVHAAHTFATRFPDGQLFLDLSGFTPDGQPLSYLAALEILLAQMGVPGDVIAADPVRRVGQWRTEISGRRLLLLLDNAVSADQVRPLIAGAAGCLVMITSRLRLTGLDAVTPFTLDIMPQSEAAELFARMAGHDRLGREPYATSRLIEECGYLPLAIRIAAARLQHRPHWTIEYMANRLNDETRRLGELSAGGNDVAAAFYSSYADLSPRQKKMFRVLGLHPGPEIDVCAAAAMSGIPLAEADTLLESLVDAHLLRQQVTGRYTFHDLLRYYAGATAQDEDPESDRECAIGNLLRYYLATASAAMNSVYPHENHRRPRVETVRWETHPAASMGSAFDWLEHERLNLVASAVCAARSGRPEYVSQLSMTVWRHLENLAYFDEARTLLTCATDVTRASGDHRRHAAALTMLSVVSRRQGQYEEAEELLHQALGLARASGDQESAGEALHNLGILYRRLGRYTEAVSFLLQAHILFEEVHDSNSQGEVLNSLGFARWQLGQHDQALACLEKSLSLASEMGDRPGEIRALNSLGFVHDDMHEDERAIYLYRRALDMARSAGSRIGEGDALNGLGSVERRIGRFSEAREHLRMALALFQDMGNPSGEAYAFYNLGLTHADNGSYAQAIAQLEEALAIFRRCGNPVGERETLTSLRDIAEARPGADGVSVRTGPPHIS